MNLFDQDFRKYTVQFLAIIFFALILIIVINGFNIGPSKDIISAPQGENLSDN